VDDNEELALVMQLTLQRAGFESHTAFSGYEALEWLDQRQPDAIILDLMMPGMNGFSILRHLRATDLSRHLPVIVLTARTDDEIRRESESAGANDYLTKPVNTTALIDHVRQALHHRDNGGDADADAGANAHRA
jgi:two-component system phosphate regulon response regulator PhoB